MRRINLIPPEFASGKKALVETGLGRQAMVIGGVVIAILLVHFGANSIALARLKREVKMLNQTLVDSRASAESFKQAKDTLNAQLENVQKRLSLFGEKRSLLAGLEGEQFKWSEALSEFHKIVPAKVWVDELLMETGKSHVRGGTFGNQLVGDFIDGLNQSSYFSNATFARTEAGELDDRPVVNFELTFELVPKRG